MARRAAASKTRPSARRGGVGGMLTVAVLLLTALVVTALPLCVLLLAGMLPSAVAAMVDRNKRRHLTAAVAILNLAGMVLPALTLVKLGMSLAGAQQVLSDPRNWLIMYGAAGVGWVLSAAMLTLARIILGIRDEREERRLGKAAARLVDEWGAEVGGG
jgi:hypothetical protein